MNEEPTMNTAISATASGSLSPQTADFPATVTNDDFLISPLPNCTPQTCPLTGDGIDETTTWTFDLTKHPDFASFSTTKPLVSALLTLTLTSKDPLGLITTDLVRIEGLGNICLAPTASSIDQNCIGFIFGTEDEVRKELSPLGEPRMIRVELLEFYSSADILGVLSANTGRIPMVYQDDAIVSSAQLDLTNRVPALQVICDD